MAERERLKQSCKDKEFDVYVTTYEQFISERHWFTHRIWRYVVVDEGTSRGIPMKRLEEEIFVFSFCLLTFRPHLEERADSGGACGEASECGIPVASHGDTLAKVLPAETLSPVSHFVCILTKVHCMNYGHYSISYIQMYSLRKPQMLSKKRSISPRGHITPPSSIVRVR